MTVHKEQITHELKDRWHLASNTQTRNQHITNEFVTRKLIDEKIYYEMTGKTITWPHVCAYAWHIFIGIVYTHASWAIH